MAEPRDTGADRSCFASFEATQGRLPFGDSGSHPAGIPSIMSATAASLVAKRAAAGDRSARQRRFARWRPPVAAAAVVLGLVGGQALALAVVLASGDGSDAVGIANGVGLLLGDAVLLAVVLVFARRGARLGAATLGIRRTRFWPALGWS